MSYKKIHQIRIDFNVTEEIRRYVFVYIIEAAKITMETCIFTAMPPSS